MVIPNAKKNDRKMTEKSPNAPTGGLDRIRKVVLGSNLRF